MQLEIEYGELLNCINVLDKLAIKGLPSIHRTRLSKDLQEKLKRVGEEQAEIHKEHFELNKSGDPIVDDEHVKDKEEYFEALKEFKKEKIVIDDGDSQVALKSVKKSLESSEIEWQGRESYTYEYLYSAFEEDNKDKDDRQDGGE